MAAGLSRVLGHEPLQLRLGLLMFQERRSRPAIDGCERGPCVGLAHIDDADRSEPWSRWFHPEEARGLAALHAAPEALLSREQQVLVERISGEGDLNPFAASG